jgi:pimeloyl-ACP methyl ester carboxylesterase
MQVGGSIAIALALSAACTGVRPEAPTFRPTAEEVACPADIEVDVSATHSCGFLTVLEDRARPEGPTIELFYLRVPPPSGSPDREPIAAVGYEIAQSPDYGSISGIAESSGRELILLDQRGTGHSEPSLACPEVDRVAGALIAEPLSSAAVRETFEGAVSACRDRLTGRGVDPEAYTVVAAGEDLRDLRMALGIPHWNLVSWGTASRVLLESVRVDEAGIRALALGSPQFPERDTISEAAGDLAGAVAALAEACAGSARCAQRYPNLEGILTEAVAGLDRSPIRLTVAGRDLTIDGAALVRVVRHLVSFNAGDLAGTVPRLVDDARRGEVRGVASILADRPGLCIGYLPRCDDPFSLGSYLSFTCPDGLGADAPTVQYARGFGDNDPYVGACRAWGVEPGAIRPEPVTTSIPALVLRGDYDAFSPLDVVAGLETGMSGAFVVRVPYRGHDVFLEECLRDGRNSWLIHPEEEPDFSGCLRRIRPPTFALGR